jgi:sugar lactone lactonase YvrE
MAMPTKQLGVMLTIPLLLAVAGCNTSTVGTKEPVAQMMTTWGTTGAQDGQFQYVEDLAVAPNGHVYATDAKNSNVQVFTSDGKFITKFGVRGDGKDNNEMMKPEGVAVDKEGNVYIADYTTGYIKKFNKDHKWLKTFGGYGSGQGQNSEAEFMSIGPNNLLYMAEAGNSEVDVFDLNRSARHWYTDTDAQAQVPGCSGRPVYESYAL